MKRLRWSAALAAVTGLVLLMAAGAPARSTVKLYTITPTSFTSNGDLINGWYWLRSNAQTAEWMFDISALPGAKRNQVFINFSCLVTKGVNGSCGYSGSLSISFVGAKTVKSSVSLVNPFRPREYPGNIIGNTGGVGYIAYGAVGVPYTAYNGATTLKVIISRSSSSAAKDIHIAANKGAALIAYIK
jgi:hypothetical protein